MGKEKAGGYLCAQVEKALSDPSEGPSLATPPWSLAAQKLGFPILVPCGKLGSSC